MTADVMVVMSERQQRGFRICLLERTETPRVYLGSRFKSLEVCSLVVCHAIVRDYKDYTNYFLGKRID